MSDSNVIGIHGGPVAPRGEVNEALVKAIEDLLGMARTGQLQSFVGTGFMADSARWTVMAGDTLSDTYSMAGSLAWLQHEYIQRVEIALEEDR